MLALLPPFALLMFIAALSRRLRSEANGLHRAILLAMTVWGVIVAILTESLSALDALTPNVVTIAWAAIALGGAMWAKPWQRPSRPDALNLDVWKCSILLLGAILVVTAIVAPPNDHDAMVYHLARIIHWTQNRDVAFYPTNIRRQLHQGPLAEYAICQLFLTGGSDRFADAVQWGAWCGCIIAAARLAGQLGGDRRAGVIAAVVAATIPIGVLEASSAQNDLVSSLWMLCAASFMLDARRTNTAPDFALAGAAVGLAILTKATAYLILAPIILWLGMSLLRARQFRSLAMAVLLVAVLAITINLPQYWRNARLYGSPVGASAEGDRGDKDAYANALFTPRAFASNVIRNIGIELGTPSPAACEAVINGVTWMHRLVGIDVNDPRTTWSEVTFNLVPQAWRNGNLASNPGHLLLVAAAFASLWIFRKRSSAEASLFAVCVVAGFLLFCFYLRWQPWHTRQHLPMFMLASAPVGLAMRNIWNARVCQVLLALLLVNSLAIALCNEMHPWFGSSNIFTRSRIDQYFYGLGSYRDPLTRIGVVSRQFQIDRAGLQCDLDAPEYLVWISLGGFDRKGLILQHVDVENASKDLPQAIPTAAFHPHLVVHIKTQTGYIGADFR